MHFIKFILFSLINYLCITVSIGQNIPSDSVLYDMIHQVNLSEKTQDTDEVFESESIIYKDYITLDDEKLLLVINKITTGERNYHIYGVIDHYYFKYTDDTWTIVKTFSPNSIEEPMPIGESKECIVTKIGKNKIGLITTFSSTGNQHYERGISIAVLTKDNIEGVGYIDLDYSNVAWSELYDECNSEETNGSYEIKESKNEWFKIIVTQTISQFDADCEELSKKTKVKQVYTYVDGKYEPTKD